MRKKLQSFKPVVDKKSEILILGSMPGPVALKKQQYYGYEGNHFWQILPRLFGLERPDNYKDRLQLLKDHHIALWDVLKNCSRVGASDSSIRHEIPNAIPELLHKFPAIKAIFINGRTAETLFRRWFKEVAGRPVRYLPSTSPAHASLSLNEKMKKWRAIKKYL